MNWKRLRRRLRDPVVAAAARLAVRVFGGLSYRGVVRLAGLAGALVNLSPRFRRLTGENLRVAFPEWPAARVAAVRRQVARNLCLTGLETAWFIGHPDEVKNYFVAVSPAAAEAFRRAAAERPLIAVIPHLGNWEMSGQFACLVGHLRLCAVARRNRNPGLDKLVNAGRTRHGLELIPERGAMRLMLRALRQGKSLGILMDQNITPERGGEFVDFFGLPVPTTRAPAALARRVGVEVACFACHREKGGFALDVKSLPKPVAAYTSDLELTQDLLGLNEAFIREHPEQYMWFYERWRLIPPDASPEARARFPSYARPYQARAVSRPAQAPADPEPETPAAEEGG